MEDTTSIVFGFIKFSGSVTDIRDLIRQAGFSPSEGDSHHVTVRDFEHILLREHTRTEYKIEADSDSSERLISEMSVFTAALSKVGVDSRYEIYDHQDEMVFQKDYTN